ARMQRALADLDEESQDIPESIDTEQLIVPEVILPPESDNESIPATDETEDKPRNLGDLPESIELTGESEAVSEGVAYSAPVSTDEDALFELDEDQELIEIFVEESKELLETLDQDFEKWSVSPDDGAITDDIKRTLHTLKGSSRLAGVMPVGELSHALETLFNRLTGGELSFTQPLKSVVREALDRLASQTDQTAATGQVAQADELLERIEQIGQAEEGREMPEEDSIDPLLQQELEESEETAAELPAVDDETPSDYYEEPLSFIHEGDLYEFEGDPELIEIFIEESRELLGVLDESHAAWSENLANHAPLDEMQRALHTLKGSSRLAGIEPVGDLSHALESLLSGISMVKLEPSEAVLNTSREALDLLATQTDAAEGMGGIPVSDELIQRLESLLHSPAMEQEETFDPHLQEELDESTSPADDADYEVEPPATTLSDESLNIAEDVLALDDSEAELSDEMDDSFVVMEEDILLDVGEDEELVQIFVEEAKDFVEQIETHFQTWMEQTEDLSLIEGVQRNLHTLKGSSRLAGIMPVGDLSHAVESLMTALAQEEVDPLPLVTDAARQAIDFLAHQVEMIGSIGKVPASDELVTGL
ncbi:MAG: Hpt domain-containing protein, partial [Candidatus Thiodiazotropha sp. (ex Notomyrtea botanica)]|nr:Hpt domain-containing protein [Candidatus Thiodiazotropha sp. (ex Notomyrtea botanica)]